jgi:hypothetical protein
LVQSFSAIGCHDNVNPRNPPSPFPGIQWSPIFFHTPSWSLRFQRYNLHRQRTTQQESWANQGQIRGKSGANQGRQLTLTLTLTLPSIRRKNVALMPLRRCRMCITNF